VKSETVGINKLLEVMDRLLAPDGCPWDREQTHRSLARYLLEETYEVLEAIQNENRAELKEELGDVLLQVVFHSALAEREGWFTFAQVAETVAQKMINRHPHVFADMDLSTSEDVMSHWEGFKKKEGKKNLLDGIPMQLPALLRAEKMQSKAARVGFDWPNINGALEKLREEINELAQAQDTEELEAEMGDVFFALVNIARIKGIDPEAALQRSNDKFLRRFNYIENRIKSRGDRWEDYRLEELDAIWDEAKGQGL